MATKKKAPASKKPTTPVTDKYLKLLDGHSIHELILGLPNEWDIEDKKVVLPTKRDLAYAEKWLAGCKKEYDDYLKAYAYLRDNEKIIKAETQAVDAWEDSKYVTCPVCNMRKQTR